MLINSPLIIAAKSAAHYTPYHSIPVNVVVEVVYVIACSGGATSFIRFMRVQFTMHAMRNLQFVHHISYRCTQRASQHDFKITEFTSLY